MWQRIRQLPFDQQIPEEERDPAVKRELCDPKLHGSAILNWLIEGCMRGQREGLKPPEAIKAATEDYQTETDPLT